MGPRALTCIALNLSTAIHHFPPQSDSGDEEKMQITFPKATGTIISVAEIQHCQLNLKHTQKSTETLFLKKVMESWRSTNGDKRFPLP